MRSISLLLNYLPDDLKQSGGKDPNGKFVIAPSDSRFRGDMRLFEDGKWEEADVEKVRLEVK